MSRYNRAIATTKRVSPGAVSGSDGSGDEIQERERRRQAELEKLRVKKALRLERKLEAVLRLQAVDPQALPYPQRLLVQRFGLYSQHEEDGIVWALLKEGGMPTRAFVDIGCGRNGGNSGFLAKELGFRGLMVDASPTIETTQAMFGSERVRVVREFVTAENLSDLLSRHDSTGEIDLLSIDVDGNDLWIWSAATECSPRVVVMEYNASWGPARALTIPYDPDFQRSKQPAELRGRYFGASLPALVALGRGRGYRLVCVDQEGINAFFLRDDVAPHVPALEPSAAFVEGEKNQRMRARGFDLLSVLDSLQHPYVDLDESGVPPPR